MLMHRLRAHKATVVAAAAAVLLALGWAARERSFAQEKARFIESRTVTQAGAPLKEFVFEGKPRGEVGVYFEGDTPGTRSFVTGQFRLRPGLEPHPIHRHPEEEILIVTAGKGEIICGDKVTKVGPGSVMYTAPDVPHGIRNTGDDVMTFYFVKWIGVDRGRGK